MGVIIGAQAFERDGALDIDVFIGGADGAGDEARLGGGGVSVGGAARDLGGGKVELVDAVGKMVIGQRHRGAAEGIGFDDVGAGFEILQVNIADDVGTGDVEDLGTVFAPQVVGLDRKRRLVDHGAHGAIDDEDTFGEDLFERLPALLGGGHKGCATDSLTTCQSFRLYQWYRHILIH